MEEGRSAVPASPGARLEENLFESTRGFTWWGEAFKRKGPPPEIISKDLAFRWSFPFFLRYLGQGAGPVVVGPVEAWVLPRALGGPSLSLLQQSFGVKWAPGLGCDLQWPLDLLLYLMFNLKLSLVFCWLFKCFGYHIVHIICTNMAI